MEDIPVGPLLSSFDLSSLIAGLVFGTIGLWVFRHGKRNANNRNVVIGLILMIYPYFVSGAFRTWGAGFVLCGYAYYTWNE